MEEILALSIPIVALMIPIVAIVVRSQVGKAFANYLETKSRASSLSIESIVNSKQVYLKLDERLRDLEYEVQHLKESNEDLHRLLKGKSDFGRLT